MNRRELLKLMAISAPTVATLGCGSMMVKPADPMSAVTTLNVIFEGPMVFLMQNPQVQVLVPQIAGHQYVIDGSPANSGTFSLRGVKSTGDVTKTKYDLPKGADAFRLSASQLNLSLSLSKTPFLSFHLPAPDRVVALSAREADIVDAFGNRRSAVMPTSYAFVYELDGSGNVMLDPNQGWNPRDRIVQSKFTNLVVTGSLPGPGLDPDGSHARSAFKEMTGFFPGLEMQFFESGTEVQTGNLDGLPPQLMQHRMPTSHRLHTPQMAPAVLTTTGQRPRLLLAASIQDCRVGGVIVTNP